MEGPKKNTSRRRFFLLVWGSFLAGVLLSVASSIRFLFPNILYEPESKMEAEKPGKYLLNGIVSYSNSGVYVLRDEKGIYAMSGICTHQGCLISWNDVKKEFFCPCHGSSFSIEGKVRMPPAKFDLTHYGVKLNRKGKVVVNLKRLVEPHFRLVI